jgi:hypothetical protein
MGAFQDHKFNGVEIPYAIESGSIASSRPADEQQKSHDKREGIPRIRARVPTKFPAIPLA